MSFTPELGYFLKKAELEPFPVTVADVITFMQPNRLFNQEIIGDILLNVTVKTYKPTFTNMQMARYLRFIVIEQGLNGLFTYRTPREYMEGYIDPLIYQMSQTPVYNGGDQTNDPFMSINSSPTQPPNNTVAFFTGTDDYMFTRRVARWLNLEYISLQRMDYDSISTLSHRYVEPWMGRDNLEGTDGMTFHCDIQSDDHISAFVPDFARVAYFTFDKSDKDKYPGLELMKFQLDKKLMQD
jgi:CD36 family